MMKYIVFNIFQVSHFNHNKFYKLCGDAFIFDGVCRMKYKGIKKAHEYYIQGNGYHDLSVECED